MASALQSELAAILEGAAIFPLDDRGFLRVTGGDATRWLNGMVTNNIAALAPGEGNYNFLLNAQGRIQGDCTIFREPAEGEPAFLLATDAAQVETIQTHLDKFIIMDDVELTAAMTDKSGLLILGAGALGTLDVACIWPKAPISLSYAKVEDNAVPGDEVVLSIASDQYEVWGNPSLISWIRSLVEREISPDTLEALRILEARPKFGQDIRDKDLPQETAQTHALNFNKGCYLGQEIVERIHSRGQVHRSFAAFTLTPEGAGDGLPVLPAELQANGKAAGTLTSAAVVPLGEGKTVLGLGYVRREYENEALSYQGGIARVRKASKEMAS